MYMDVLRSMTGIEVFPAVSLVLFLVLFAGVLVWTWRTDPARLDEIAAIPLHDDQMTVLGTESPRPRR